MQYILRNVIKMKKPNTIILIFLCLLTLQVSAQRPSPPAQVTATVDGISVTLDYSQPALKDRPFGTADFHPYGEVWRNGANEASWIELSDDAKINGETLPKGKYSFFVIPGEEEWTLIFNSAWKQWGAFSYDSSKDVMRVKAKSTKSDSYSERYTMKLDDNGKGSLNWGDFSVLFEVSK